MDRKFLLIGELAARAGVSVPTLRYYERRGLLEPPQRRPSGYRAYLPETVATVGIIKRGQRLGFTLAEIAQLLQLRARGGHAAEVHGLATAKVADLDARLRKLRASRETLVKLLDACGSHSSSASQTCRLLRYLEGESEG